MKLTKAQKNNPNEVQTGELQKRAERENYVRENRIIDSIPGRNTAPVFRDNRNAGDVEYNSHHRIVSEVKSTLAFKQRQARINFAMSQPQYADIIGRVKPSKREEIISAPGNVGITNYLQSRVIEQRKELKNDKKREKELIHDTQTVDEFFSNTIANIVNRGVKK